MQPTADIALIGLAVMGQNIILNMNDHPSDSQGGHTNTISIIVTDDGPRR